jgi:hypothetical protein
MRGLLELGVCERWFVYIINVMGSSTSYHEEEREGFFSGGKSTKDFEIDN